MKNQLRSELSAKRLSLSPEDWQRRSRVICERIVASPAWTGWSKIALYQSFRNEVDLTALLRLSPDKEYFYPKIDRAKGTMEFHQTRRPDLFQKNSWGLSEPDGAGELLVPDSKTLIIVPAMAFDRSGHRLGYGKGYYDRYLADKDVATLGVCFAEFLLDSLPSEPHDQAVQNIITDRETFRKR